MKNKALMYIGIAVLGYVAYRHFYKKPKTIGPNATPPPTTTPKPLDLKPTMIKNPNL